MPRKGGRRKKTRTHLTDKVPENAPVQEEDNIPRTLVAKISKVSPPVNDLIHDLRRLLGPYTAMNLKERKYNKMKDFISVATQLNLSHLLLLSQTESNVILRVGRYPNGPTLHFRINHFLLPKQIKMMQKRPFESLAAYKTPPVLVLNNFGQSDELHVKLMKITFQNMFPTINVKTVKLADCRRVVLFHFNKSEGTVEMRHYAVRANPVGISRSVKRIIQSKVPNLGELHDISDFIDGSSGFCGAASDSEAEDEGSKVTLPERYVGKGNAKSQLSAMKLTELGPRLTLEIYKVEQGVGEGDILYHKFIQKSPEEAAATKARVEKEKKLKEERRKNQEDNVKRKREALEEKKRVKAEKKRQRLENGEKDIGDDEESDEEEEEDDDFPEDGDSQGDDEVDEENDGDYEEDDNNDEDDDEGEYEEEEEEEEDNDDEEDDEEDEEIDDESDDEES